MINLIVVEDNTHVQERLREILRGATDMKIVGMYPDLRSAITATPSPVPNLIVLDLKLPDVKGSEAITSLKEKFQYKSVMQVPSLSKIVVNKGIGAAVADKKLVDIGVDELTQITGQKAVPTKSKKAISNFKLRENMPIGAKVTLRGDRMYEFLDRLVSVALPRVRDFKGINNKSFDGRGNYTLGVTEQIIFPEIDIDKISKITGMDITFVTTAKNDEQAFELLKQLGLPFKGVKKDQ